MRTNGVYTLNKYHKASDKCLDLIKGFEGFSPVPYYCQGGKYTIGYGTTRGVHKGMRVTHEEAIEMLKADVQIFADAVSRLVKVPLNQNQFDALVSWTYNVGEGNLKNSTLLKLLNQGNYDDAALEIKKWRNITTWDKIKLAFVKIVSKGLVNRREAEYALFVKPSNIC